MSGGGEVRGTPLPPLRTDGEVSLSSHLTTSLGTHGYIEGAI